ncbi:MAG: hypothetical protein ACKVUS_17275 [Saprospiraceae bacterium]
MSTKLTPRSLFDRTFHDYLVDPLKVLFAKPELVRPAVEARTPKKDEEPLWNRFVHYLQNSKEVASSFWQVFRLLTNQYVLIALFAVVLLGSDQGRDLLRSVGEQSWVHFVLAEIALILLGIFTWGSSRVQLMNLKIALKLSDEKGSRNLTAPTQTALGVGRILPRLTAIAPFVIFAAGLFRQNDDVWCILAHFAVTFFFLWYISAKLTVSPQIVDYSNEPDDLEDDLRIISFIDDRKYGLAWQTLFVTVFVTLGLVPITIYAIASYFNPNGSMIHIIGTAIGPLASVFVGFASMAVWTTLLIYWQGKFKLPIVLTTVVMVFYFSHYNNNHTIRANGGSVHTDRPEVAEHFGKWVESKKSHWLTKGDTVSMPVYFIAVEGGGIRAANWTAQVLNQLSSADSTFYDRTFAISGSSGGMVGSLMYQWLRKAQNDHAIAAEARARDSILYKFVSADYLSGSLLAFYGPDLLQNFLPFPVEYFDRARSFENAVEYEFCKATGLRGDTVSFFNFWEKDPYKYPSLLLQGTIVETAQRALYSNLKVSADIFPNTLDVHAYMEGDLSMARASSMCDRFPLIMPPGRIVEPGHNGKPLCNIVDGGYFENTGLLTLQQIIGALPKSNGGKILVQTTDAEGKPVNVHIKPVIIFIQNGDLDIAKPFQALPTEYSERYKGLSASFVTFLNLQNGKTINTINDLRRCCERDALFDFCVFRLNRNSGVELPLGWFISKDAAKDIQQQALRMHNPSNSADMTARANSAMLEWLKDHARDSTKQRSWEIAFKPLREYER